MAKPKSIVKPANAPRGGLWFAETPGSQSQPPVTTKQKTLPVSVPGMPNGDQETAVWMQNLADGLATDPEWFASTRWESDQITALVKAFDEALMNASNRGRHLRGCSFTPSSSRPFSP